MSTIIKSKAGVFGDYLNSRELLEALKSPLFKEKDSLVQITTPYGSDYLTLIYECKTCGHLHFHCRKIISAILLCQLNELKVYGNNWEQRRYYTKEDVIHALEQLSEVKKIILEHPLDKNTYALTKVSRCSNTCPIVHLDCSYTNNILRLN